MTRVVLDTNALMMPVEIGVRLFEELDRLLGEYEPVVPRAVVEELRDLSVGGGEEATAASVGLDLTDRCTVVDHDADYADDAVLEVAAEAGCVVTNDDPLKQRLLEQNVPVIRLRGHTQLERIQP
ncbi:MAG: DUF188 domain-containing protein [Natronomonas sp.]